MSSTAGKIGGLALILVVGFVVTNLGKSGSGSAAKNICADITTAQITKILSIAEDVNLLPGRRGETTEVDERVWIELPRDGKISLALALYCQVPGRTTLILRGWRDGDTKASVVNGNYMD